MEGGAVSPGFHPLDARIKYDEENEQSAEGPTHRVGQERHGLIVGSAPPFSQAFLPEITEQTGPLASPTS
jgi:hypothetical protein